MFFAGGSGITPIYSIIKSLLQNQPLVHLTLIYANRDINSIIFKNKVEFLESSYQDRFTIVYVLSAAKEGDRGLIGRLDSDKIIQFMDKWKMMPFEDTSYYVCGPSQFMELVEKELVFYKVPTSKIHFERFISISNAEDPIKLGAGIEDINSDGARLNVQLDGMTQKMHCKKDQILLNALLEAGINAPYSCKEGICSSCKAKLVEGVIIMKKHTSLNDIDLKNDQILTCQAIPLSANIKIDYDIVIQ